MQEFCGLGEITGVSFLQTSLRDLPIELASGKIYIGNDTGIKHLCIALGLKSISFFGPEPPVEWHPYNQNEHPFYYIDNLDCRTQTAHFCGLSTCDSMICLNQISAERVFIDNKKNSGGDLMLTVYGIPNCDKMKKVFKMLEAANIEYNLYNYKKSKPTKELLQKWREADGEWPVNKRGTTYRKLKDAFEVASDNEKCQLIIENSSMIKRPIVEDEKNIVSIGDLDSLSTHVNEKM